MAIVIERVDAPTDDARTLIGELDAELAGPYAAEERHGLSVDRVFQPNVRFFVARFDGRAVGCAGVAFDHGFAEVKRMYVRPEARGGGGGVAIALLARLEAEASARGISRLTLETGDAQHAAIRFYEREGFTRCAAFGAYATMPPAAVVRSVFYEKVIA
jgi:putative acetyltransferase